MGSFGLSVDRSNSACVIVRDTELQVGFLHGAVLHPNLLSPRHAVSRDVCRMSTAVPLRAGTSPTQSSRSSLSFPSSTENTNRWDTVWKSEISVPRLLSLLFLSFVVSVSCLSLASYHSCICSVLWSSLFYATDYSHFFSFRWVCYLLVSLRILRSPMPTVLPAPALPTPVRPSCRGSNSKAWAEDQILEVNGEPCTGEDISSKLEDKDVQDGPSRTGRFDAERVLFA